MKPLSLTPDQIRLVQATLNAVADAGLVIDGHDGPKTTAAVIEFTDRWETGVQTVAGPSNGPFECKASSFADPADVEAYKRAKAQGMTDIEAFSRGDNGIGQFGKITAQDQIPMIAVHHDAMVARWGSVNNSAHKPVTVTANGQTISATVEDRISEPGRIDLNPACARLLGLHPPFVVPCVWSWA